MAAKAKKKSVSATFEFENDTKNKVRFTEDGEKDTHKSGKQYIMQDVHKDLGQPKRIKVTWEAID